MDAEKLTSFLFNDYLTTDWQSSNIKAAWAMLLISLTVSVHKCCCKLHDWILFFCSCYLFVCSQMRGHRWLKNWVENKRMATISVITPRNETLKRQHICSVCQSDEASGSYTDSMNGCGNILALHWGLFNHCHQLRPRHNQSNICPIDFSPN